MPSTPSLISEYFGGIRDPQSGDNWVDMEMFGNANQAWFETFLDLRHGVPYHDTFGRVFQRLAFEEFQKRFLKWTTILRIKLKGEVLSVDGKTERGSKDSTLGLASWKW